MIKVPRFMREYANYQKKFYKSNTLMNENTTTEIFKTIDKVIKTFELGRITVTETMELITSPIISEN